MWRWRQPPGKFDDAHIKPADPGAHDHHHHHHDEEHKAPHGGTLVALGDHQYHAENAWDETAKTITVYVLDGEAEKAVPIDVEEIVLAVGIGKDAETHKFTAKPQENDGDGKCSRFVSSDKALFDKFHDSESTSGQIDLPIGEKTFPSSSLMPKIMIMTTIRARRGPQAREKGRGLIAEENRQVGQGALRAGSPPLGSVPGIG
ncbi:MAG: hypothetical protein CM1200mP2_42190 [Planctomycetaceae bacterium]|nr:MAG: hypothetical protein CM1200mP2_42190 [Planctomycetaceae bacterium]